MLWMLAGSFTGQIEEINILLKVGQINQHIIGICDEEKPA